MKTDGMITAAAMSPHAKLAPCPLNAVRWTEGFWAEHWEQARETTVHVLWEGLADPAAGHVLDNFRIAAGMKRGETQGTWWQDAWLYKWIEAAACIHAMNPDPWLDERMDEGIALIAAAQAPDGYVWTHIANPHMERYAYIRHHEVYAMGHLLTAAVVHRRMTGKDTFLRIARQVAEHLGIVLGRTVKPCFAHNPSAVMGLVEIYRETGNRDYLNTAQLIVDARGSEPSRHGRDLWHRNHGIEGTDQIQDRIPVRKAAEVVGHNVFFTYLFAGAADICLETGEKALEDALERMWLDLVGRKINVNGGVSPMGRGLSIHGDIVIEAVGAPYVLPHADAYNETCGQIGNLMWNWRRLLAHPSGRYADMIEHEIYNGILPGMGLDGASFWYRNQLRRHQDDTLSSHNHLAKRELPGRTRICCPTNLLRTVAQFQNYAYTTAENTVWVHQYGAATANLVLPDGNTIVLRQDTEYPWEGTISLTVEQTGQAPWALRLRIPEWAAGAALELNGTTCRADVLPGQYATVQRTWNQGDHVDLQLPMNIRLVEAHPKAEHCRNQVAVFRGPVLYCLESPDLDTGIDLDGVIIPADSHWNVERDDTMPFGIRVLTGNALYRQPGHWQQRLYATLATGGVRRVPIRLIPYLAWANRGPSDMSVWLPVSWPRAEW